ncbi:MAG: DsrE/DsrF/DrsH-like family protein [Nitrospirae bacterium]|nr:DsrE/DsrF/DrsH-like family protein [Nitrospirota bacterium]
MGEIKSEKMTIVLCSGDLDKALMAFTLINAGAALNMEVSVFFTFGGIDIVTKEGARREGETFFEKIHSFFARGGAESLTLSKYNLFGIGARATKERMRRKKIMTLNDHISAAKMLGVKLTVCEMAMETVGVKKEDLIEEVDEVAGAAAFLANIGDARINYFI